MPRVSQGLIDFANHVRHPPASGFGFEVIETPRYRIVLQPDYQIAGPNSVAWIRCREEEVDEVVAEVRSTMRPRGLPLMWVLDPETEPSNLGEHLARYGILPDAHSPHVDVMVLPIDARLHAPEVDGLELHDALASAEAFRRADAVNAEGFGEPPRGLTPDEAAAQERRRAAMLGAGNRHMILATIDGEDAGAAALTLYPTAALINGAAVLTRFRRRGVYRAMLAARLALARQPGVEGLVVWGGSMSAPILARTGFQAVGWRRFYRET